MTTVLTILSTIGLIAVCYVISKYHKNDNLFWMLVISLLAGMAGGAIAKKLSTTTDSKKDVMTTQVYNPTQVSPAICVDFYTQLGDILASMANPASEVLEIPARDSKVSFYAPSKTSGEIRGQPTFNNPLNKGTPGMPFDTS